MNPRFKETWCSSCGEEQGPGDSGFSHCEDHERKGGARRTNTMKATLTIDVEFNPDIANADQVAEAVDDLLSTALSTPGVLDEYGNPELEAVLVQESPADASHQPKVGVAQDATYLFDQITGASYYGFGFRQVLLNDPEALAAARTLVDLLKHHGCKGME